MPARASRPRSPCTWFARNSRMSQLGPSAMRGADRPVALAAQTREEGCAPCYAGKGGIYLSQVGLRHGRSTAGDGGDLFGSVGRGRPGCGLAIRLR